MASETIYKLEPHRTLHLKGFDGDGAAAALVNASATGFTLKGVFRDMADFCVLTLFDADDYFGHYQVNRYLPNFDFTGQKLTFDIATTGLQPLDSPKSNWIDWQTLDYITEAGVQGQVNLWSLSPTQVGGTYTAASATWTLNGTPAAFDRVTLWYNNIAFDYIASSGDTAATVCAAIAAQINAYSYSSHGVLIGLTATASGNTVVITAAKPGYDGNMIRIYELHKNTNLYFTPAGSQSLSGGSSAATWRVSIDFSALAATTNPGITSLRTMWLTFAPQLAGGVAYTDTDWTATVTNWNVTDPSSTRALKIAGPGSVRVASRSQWVSYSGSSWVEEASNQPGGTGWYHGGFAHRMSTPGDSVTVRWSCGQTHDLYIGTSLYSDRGQVSVSIDGGAPTTFDAYLGNTNGIPIVTRRQIATGIAAGTHTATFTLSATHNASSTGFYFYFDFLEAVVYGDVPAPAVTYSNLCPATDYDTDHAYRLSPARLAWQIDRMGFNGDLDHYVGVFWWNQRKNTTAACSTLTITYGGTWANGDSAFITISGVTMGKSVFPTDTPATIAAHFAYFINETFVGVWASAAAGVLTITTRTPAWSFAWSQSFSSSAGTVTTSGNLNTGTMGTWMVDNAKTPVLNSAASAWHADFFAQLAALGKTATASFSMELINPPDNPPTATWAQRFADGTVVQTDTGVGTLTSTQCTFSSVVQAYQQQAYAEMAALMVTAGLTPWLQFGEYLWWYFNWWPTPATTRGMALYDADTTAAATAALGRALATFSTPNDSPSINSYADANFLRERIKAHIDGIRSYVLGLVPTAKFELLYPNDVTFATPTPIANLGGALNHYINLPVEYFTKTGSGLDRLKMESLAFGATERNMTYALNTIAFPQASPLSWPLASTAYLVPWFNGDCPWKTDYLAAYNAGIPIIVLWAHDHGPLMSWPLPMPVNPTGAKFT